MTLARQFALAGGTVMLLAALAVGAWVSRRIEEVVVRNTANATALYMESFIAPLMQDLAVRADLPLASRLEIGRLIADTALGARVVSFKLWREDGLLVEASNEALVGQRFEVTENLRLAWSGDVRADFDSTGDAEDVAEAALGLPLLEVYSPIREIGSGRVIAVAEFYEVATQLQDDLDRARLASWAAVVGVMSAIGATLFAIVLRGSWTIDRQLAALQALSERNVALRMRVQGAAGRHAALNDRTLERIGADLHDGPAQLMGYVALRLDSLRAHLPPDRQADLDAMAGAVRDSIAEVRNIARGLSLPDLERKPMDRLLASLAEAHAARTGTQVTVACDLDGRGDIPVEVKTCVYRVAQEGLSNAWRHGGGAGQELRLDLQGDTLTLRVLDRGPGFGSGFGTGGGAAPGAAVGMGLPGLTDRVESLGGTMQARNRPGGGAELVMTIDMGGA